MQFSVHYYFMRFNSQGLDQIATIEAPDTMTGKELKKEIDSVFKMALSQVRYHSSGPYAHAIVKQGAIVIGKIAPLRGRVTPRIQKFNKTIRLHNPSLAPLAK